MLRAGVQSDQCESMGLEKHLELPSCFLKTVSCDSLRYSQYCTNVKLEMSSDALVKS